MKDRIFVFDLDSTITAEEILPRISLEVNKVDEMRELTEVTMQGILPFNESFIRRVKILSEIPVSKVQKIVADVALNEKIVKFLREYKKQCYIVTGNLDVWIKKLIRKIGMEGHCFCSRGETTEDRILSIKSIINKRKVSEQFLPDLIVVGDGNNDAEMMAISKIGIGCGVVREVAPAVKQCCKMIVYDELTLYNILVKLAKEVYHER